MPESDYPLLNDRDALQERVQEEEPSDIADDIGSSAKAVVDWTLYYDIEIPDHWPSGIQTESNIDALNDVERLSELAAENPIREVARELDVSPHSVKKWLLRHGIAERHDGRESKHRDESANHNYGDLETAAWAQTGVAWRDEFQLRRAYWGYYWSTREIAEWAEHNPSRGLITDIMKDARIEIRSQSEAQRIRHLRSQGASLERMRHEVPPPWVESEGDVEVEWSRLTED